MLKKELCIVLKKNTFSERDLMITAIGVESGKIHAYAKNALHSKRFGSSLDFFSISEWQFQCNESTGSIRVDKAELIKSFSGIQKNWEKYAVASFVTEVILLSASEDESTRKLFQLYTNTLMRIEECHSNEELFVVSNAYLYKHLQWAGLQPSLHHCLGCQTSKEDTRHNNHYLAEPKSGGWYCIKCSSKLHHAHSEHSTALSFDDLESIYYYGKTPIRKIRSDRLEAVQSQKIFNFLIYMLFFHAPNIDIQKLKTLSFHPFYSKSTKQPQVNHPL